ncbi:MAG: LysR family transcriptional regulator [Desulfobulbaceae bacterium]|nr:LysR family transcriptional regulator [Desulfobulbaceae bacterium]
MKKQPGKQTTPSSEGFQCHGRIWLNGSDGTFLAYGRIVLLERIQQFGSISQAAKSMGMSYKHAWDLVDSLNRQADQPLVSKSSGGKRGGGTTLTARGIQAIAAYWAMDARFQTYLAEETRRFVAEYLPEPP